MDLATPFPIGNDVAFLFINTNKNKAMLLAVSRNLG